MTDTKRKGIRAAGAEPCFFWQRWELAWQVAAFSALC